MSQTEITSYATLTFAATIDNTMLFLEVDDVERHWTELKALDLPARYENVRLTAIRTEHWGKECFLHDPSGILWHFGEFQK